GGQDPPRVQDPPRWAFRWKEGERFFLETTEEVSLTLKNNPQPEQKLDLKYTWVSSYTVKQLDANKNILLEQKIESFKIEGKAGAMGWDQPKDKQIEPFIGARFDVTLSPQGEVIRLEGHDKLLNLFPAKDRDVIRLL